MTDAKTGYVVIGPSVGGMWQNDTTTLTSNETGEEFQNGTVHAGLKVGYVNPIDRLHQLKLRLQLGAYFVYEERETRSATSYLPQTEEAADTNNDGEADVPFLPPNDVVQPCTPEREKAGECEQPDEGTPQEDWDEDLQYDKEQDNYYYEYEGTRYYLNEETGQYEDTKGNVFDPENPPQPEGAKPVKPEKPAKPEKPEEPERDVTKPEDYGYATHDYSARAYGLRIAPELLLHWTPLWDNQLGIGGGLIGAFQYMDYADGSTAPLFPISTDPSVEGWAEIHHVLHDEYRLMGGGKIGPVLDTKYMDFGLYAYYLAGRGWVRASIPHRQAPSDLARVPQSVRELGVTAEILLHGARETTEPTVPPLICQNHNFSALEATATEWRTKLFVNSANEHGGLKPEVVAALEEMEAEDYVIDSLQVAIVTMPVYDGSGNATGIAPQVVLTVRHPQFTDGKLVIFENTAAHLPLTADALSKRVEELKKAKDLDAAKEKVYATYEPDQYQFTAGRPQEAQLVEATAKTDLASFERYVKDAGILANYSAVRRNLHQTADVIKALNTLADGSVQFYLHATSSVEGSDEVNMTLSIRRAQFIGKWLTLLEASPQKFVGTGEAPEFLAHSDNADADARSRNLALRSRATENRTVRIVFGEQDVGLNPTPTTDQLTALKAQENSLATSRTIKVLKASAANAEAVQIKPAKFHDITFLAYVDLQKFDLPERQPCTAIVAEPFKIDHINGALGNELPYGSDVNPADNIAISYPESTRLTDADAFYTARTQLQADVASASTSVDTLVGIDLATLTTDALVRAKADEIYKKLEDLEVLRKRNERLIDRASNAEEDTFDTNVFFWSSNDTEHRVAYKKPLYNENRGKIIELRKKVVEFFRRLQAHKPTPPTPTTFTLGNVVVADYADGAGKVIIDYTGPALARADIKVTGKNGSEKKATAGNPDPVEVTGDKITINFSGIGAGKKYFYTIQQKNASGNFADLIKVEFTASTGIATVSDLRPAPADPAAEPAPADPAAEPPAPADPAAEPAPADPSADPALPDPSDLLE